MLRYTTLISGSSGNISYIENETDAVLLDGGISFKELSRLSDDMGIALDKVRGILLTHEHSDHSKGVGVISRKLKVPIYTTSGTWGKVRFKAGKVPEEHIQLHHAGDTFNMESLRIETFALSHDALDPCGYMVGSDDRKVAFVTDTGVVEEELCCRLKECAGLVLESNHDMDMLITGPYPYSLIKRIRSDQGHLSNKECRELLLQVVGERTKAVTLAHLSGENNRPSLARTSGEQALSHRQDVTLCIASRYKPTEWIVL